MPSLKRKRGSETTASRAKEEDTSSSRDAIDAIFRRHFESKFGAVDITPVASKETKRKSKKISRKAQPEDDDESLSSNDNTNTLQVEDLNSEEEVEDEDEEMGDSEESGDDWEGFDEDDNTPAAREPEVVTYDFSRRGPPPTTKPSHRSFMTSKPPTSVNSTSTAKSKPKSAKDDKDDPSEVLNLKNDLALHRLLSESHLLDKETLTHSSGANRLKAVESRIQSLGGTPMQKLNGSDARIPMHIKKGMVKKQAMRVEKEKRIAKENGIVVAKTAKKKKERKRDSGVGNPSVGKFRKGALVLSKKDVLGMRA
ncbi:hypothetical protein H072_3400 [Dactylellina haptotyla CBS 200.50]|uniref:Protein FAF1 n=1 Tax=Dactylellina haptotyla (strain CBS 200.50) TaxID=1284197 RepID=S8BT13_DACHA|nr:hypothetical protein H072_3400 [Dactylellina haptotyla CBS 200.50]